ncbi:MAG: DUF1643 domain-containing protein, partial [Candidatus Omnitrophica bacterium]|nr:DUF1643 domain-containing protein [Candidatus Omnitrophota bacterium]
GWIMLNLYPQRATDPNNLHQSLDTKIHKINLKHIEKVFQNNPKPAVWAAWGNLITRRRFLKQCLKDIINVSEHYSIRWVRMGDLLVQGHPHHPLYLRNDAQFFPFNIKTYLNR